MKYTLGQKASIFFDASTGLKIIKGHIVEPNSKQTTRRKFKNALDNGFIVKVSEEVKKDPTENLTIPELLSKFKQFLEEGLEPKVIAKKFNLQNLKDIAESIDLEVEEDDTRNTLAEAIIKEITEGEDDSEDEDEDEDSNI